LAKIYAFPIENATHAGTPDIGSTLGFIELKLDQLDSEGKLPLRHLRPEQVVFHLNFTRKGGASFILVVVTAPGKRNKYALFHGSLAEDVAGEDYSRLEQRQGPMNPDFYKVWDEEEFSPDNLMMWMALMNISWEKAHG
jgi:hypothetical protein